ncbi:MAG: Abi family protein [Prevotella sp.]|nr:Abi family protein [Prevotella sp.]
MEIKVTFSKEYMYPSDLVLLLQKRGLIIEDTTKAKSYLQHIGYYRLSAYMHPFLQIPKSHHSFKPGTSFRNIMILYRFDKKLRLLIFNEIEKIEVAVRSAIVNSGCEITGNPFWILDKQNFINLTKHRQMIRLIDEEFRRSREDFIVHFKRTYTDNYPPAWILCEILPFGVLTNLYSNIRNMQLKKAVAHTFSLQVAPFISWLTIVTLTRNSCCHHARVWNKQNSILPMVPKRMQQPWITLPTDMLRIYFDLCIIKYFLNIISPQNDMTDKLKKLLTTFPEVDIAAMGFPSDWLKEPLWNH